MAFIVVKIIVDAMMLIMAHNDTITMNKQNIHAKHSHDT